MDERVVGDAGVDRVVAGVEVERAVAGVDRDVLGLLRFTGQ